MKKHPFLLICMAFAFSANPVFAAHRVAGPMVGHTTDKQSRIWLQTHGEGDVSVRYWPRLQPKNIRTISKKSSENTFYTSTLLLKSLQPGLIYDYEVMLNGEKLPPQGEQTFKTSPKENTTLKPLSVMLGSCFYVNDGFMNAMKFGYSGGFEIFKAMANTPADMMFWLGDNSYYNPYDLTNIWSMNRRLREHRSSPHIQALLGKMPHYATWDDHDFGPNNSNRHSPLKKEALTLFKTYWPNPQSGLLKTPGVFFKMEKQDVSFLVTDNRYYRDPDKSADPNKAFLGKEQMKWLKQELKMSQSTFKVIVVGNPVLNRHYNESFFRYQKELQSLFGWIDTHKINGVIFISGDRHHSDLVKMNRKGAYPFYNFTVSPLTSMPTQVLNKGEDTDNWRVPGSLLQERNFGLFQVSGSQGKRAITLKLHDKQGLLKWEYTISEDQLKYPGSA